jgi:hypothetical protein
MIVTPTTEMGIYRQMALGPYPQDVAIMTQASRRKAFHPTFYE